jgi:hypothetical protein
MRPRIDCAPDSLIAPGRELPAIDPCLALSLPAIEERATHGGPCKSMVGDQGLPNLIRERGYAAYYPVIARPRGRQPALFPSYLFVYEQMQWSPIMYCPGVIRVLGNRQGGTLAVLSDAFINVVRGRERGGVVRLPPPPFEIVDFDRTTERRI